MMFTDAEAMHRENPDTFWAPSLDPGCLDDLDALKPGDYIKVSCGEERFWAKIVSRPEEGAFVATVANNLLFTAELEYGDRIEVEERHIYSYMESEAGRQLWKDDIDETV